MRVWNTEVFGMFIVYCPYIYATYNMCIIKTFHTITSPPSLSYIIELIYDLLSVIKT